MRIRRQIRFFSRKGSPVSETKDGLFGVICEPTCVRSIHVLVRESSAPGARWRFLFDAKDRREAGRAIVALINVMCWSIASLADLMNRVPKLETKLILTRPSVTTKILPRKPKLFLVPKDTRMLDGEVI